MRRLVVAMIAVSMLVMLAGCGGGGESDSGEVAVQTEGVPAPATTDVAEEGADLTPLEEQVFEPFPADEEILTDEIAQRLQAEQPILVYFYDSSQKTSDDQRAEIDAVLDDYRGLIELVSYDVGKYVSIAEDGEITVLTSMADDETAKKIANLLSPDFLDVRFTPYLVFVNSDGYVTYRYRGPVDSSLVEREVLRATE